MSKYVPARRMLTASIGDAVLTLVIVLVVQQAAPIWTGFGITLGIVLGTASYLFVRFRSLVVHKPMWRHVLTIRMLLNRDLILSAFGRMEFAALAWSTTLVSPAVSAILFATWPMMFILFLERAARTASGERRYNRVNLETFIYFAVAFAGLALVIAAQSTDIGPAGVMWSDTVAGVGLAILSAVLAASNAFVYSWGITLRNSLGADTRAAGIIMPTDDMEVATTMFGTMVSTMLAVPVLFVLSLTEPGWHFSIRALGIMTLVGMSLVTYLLLLQRRANLGTENLGVNAIAYSTPVFALALFGLFDQVGEVRTDFVVMGAIAIVAMNLFLSFDPDFRLGFNRRMSFKALVIGFWAVGCVVYMRDDWLPGSKADIEAGAYWTLVALIGTIFTLILSFHVSKIQTRINFEVHHTALAFRKVENLVSRGVLHRLSIRALIRIDSAYQPAALTRHYATIRRCFRRSHREIRKHKLSMSNDLSAAEGDIDSLVQSKQFGKEFAELVSVILLGALTVSLLVIMRPQLQGWVGLANDAASVVICAVLIFLVVNLFDLHRERHTPLITEHPQLQNEYGVLLRQRESPLFEQMMSAGVGGGIVVAFAVLLYVRWF